LDVIYRINLRHYQGAIDDASYEAPYIDHAGGDQACRDLRANRASQAM